MRKVIALWLLLAPTAGCTDDGGTAADARGPDAATPLDLPPVPPDIGPDLAPWVGCDETSLERTCAPMTGDPCCLRVTSVVCPPTWSCVAHSCPSDPLAPDAGPCAPGSFCRSHLGCACIPAMGGPCPCKGSCVTSCATVDHCDW